MEYPLCQTGDMDDNSVAVVDKKEYLNILVTAYEVAIKDIAVLSTIQWRSLIVDKAQRRQNQISHL